MIYYRVMKHYKLLLLALFNTVLVGCGQSGPLYLPVHAAPTHVEPDPATKPEPKTEKNK
jgi:predicted small lipoprotein YifL